MSPKNNNITPVEKEEWEAYIDKKFKTIYWIHSSLALATLMIFISVTGPLTTELMNIKGVIQNFITKDTAFDRFITKDQYHQLQKEEHISDIEAVRNPENSETIYMRQNYKEAERLNVSSSRGAEK